MPSSTAELEVQIRLTKAFINTRPETIVLTPYDEASDGAGGRRYVPLPARPPQVVRFVESGSLRSNIRSTETGDQYEQDSNLIMMPDGQIAVDDRFVWDNSTWRVSDLGFPNDYEIRATVVRYGR